MGIGIWNDEELVGESIRIGSSPSIFQADIVDIQTCAKSILTSSHRLKYYRMFLRLFKLSNLIPKWYSITKAETTDGTSQGHVEMGTRPL